MTRTARASFAFAAGALFFALAFVQRVAPSVMTAELMRDFAVGGAALGALSAWYFYAYAGIQLPVGVLNDRFGPRKLMSVALGVCAVASVGFAFSESLPAASLFRALIGASVAFAFVGTLTIAGDWFAPKRFAMLAGLVQSVGMLGAMLGQAPLRYAVEVFGWRVTVGALAGVAVMLAVLIFFTVPRRPVHAGRHGDDGNRNGDNGDRHADDGDNGNRHDDNGDNGNRHDDDGDDTDADQNFLAGVTRVVANPQSWACAGIGFGMTAIMLAFAGLWAVPYLAQVHGWPVARAAAVSSLLFFGWALGAPVMGWLSDHTGKRKPVMLVGILCNSVIFSFLLFAGVTAPAAFAVLFFALGVSGSMMTVAFGSMREVNPPRHRATAMGLVNMCVVGSGAVMQPLVGALLDWNWDGVSVAGARVYSAAAYTNAFSVLILCNLLALACVLTLRETHCRPLPKFADGADDS